MIPPPTAILCEHVSHVIAVRPDEQVVWIDASRVVAAMQYVHTIGNSPSIGHLPRHSVRPIRSLPPATYPVSRRARCACPKPAVTLPTAIHARPKTLLRIPPGDTLLLVVDHIAPWLALHVPPAGPVAVRDAGPFSAPATTESVPVGPVFGNSGVNGTIMVRHRNLHSGEPVGVTSTATGNFVTLNYSGSLAKLVTA